MSDLEQPSPSIEDLLSVLIVQNQRIYDVLLVLLFKQDAEAFNNLIGKHKEMDNLGPAPFIMED